MLSSKIFSFLYNDPLLQDFNSYFNKVKGSVDLIKLELELDEKLDKRIALKSVSLNGDIDYLELRTMIINNSVESQLLRSRLCHLRIESYKHLKRLKERMDSLRKYMTVEYKTQLDQLGIKTQTDKNYIIETCFLDCTNFITELETLEQSIIFFIDDLDKNLWTLKNLVDILELVFKGRVGI